MHRSKIIFLPLLSIFVLCLALPACNLGSGTPKPDDEDPLKTALPRFSPDSGTYTRAQSVAISCVTPGAIIRYTINGSEPNENSTVYGTPISVGTSLTLKAIAIKDGMADSDVVTAVYTIETPSSGTAGRYFWGRWVRMDTDEEWHVTDTTLGIEGDTGRTITSISANSLVFPGGSIERKTENTAEAVLGSATYTLFRRDGAFGSLTGRIMADQSSARPSRLLGGVGSIRVIVQNIANQADVHEAVTDPTGVFTVPEYIIPNETYEIIPQPSEEVPGVPPPAVLIPNKTTEDVGTLIAAPVPYNFKMSYTQSAEYLYAGGVYYDIDILVTNTGSEASIATKYTLTPDSGINFEILPGIAVIMGSISPGASKTISTKIRCETFSAAYQDKKVFIVLADDINNRTWEDSVSLRFYKREVAFNISSLVNPVYGVVITPDRKTVQFSTSPYSGQYYSTQVRLPYQPGYLVAFSKATESSEAKYGFGIDTAAPTSTQLTAFNTPSVFEPNDDEDAAYEMAVTDVVTSYLHMGDADYFVLVDNKVSMPAVVVSGDSRRGGSYEDPQFVRLACATVGATIRYTVNGDDPDATVGETYATNQEIIIDKTSPLKVIALKSGFKDSALMKEEYVFPMSVTITAYERIMLGFWTTVNFSYQTERWLGFEITQAGDYDLSLSDAGEGQARETVDASITLVSQSMVPISAVNIASAYLTPIEVHLEPGTYLCRIRTNDSAPATGTCSVGVLAHVAGE